MSSILTLKNVAVIGAVCAAVYMLWKHVEKKGAQ